MEFMQLLLFLLPVWACLIEVDGKESFASVVFDSDGQLVINAGYDSSQPMVAWGKFRDEINSTGWSFLEVHSNASLPDKTQAMAAGMAEGVLTAKLMYKSYQNTLAGYCDADPDFCTKLGKFLGENLKWMMEQITSNPKDEYWYQINLILEQFKGIIQGYLHDTSIPPIDDFGFLLMQADCDLEDLEQVLGKKEVRRVFGSGSCSALIKVLPGNKDLYISHVTWTSYAELLRVFKLYDIGVTVRGSADEIIPGRKQSFSSYPGTMASLDDFYMLSSGMVSQETTIGNSNPDLWKYVVERGIVLEWIRSIVANRLARTTVEWGYYFSQHNSGTYNNEWMVLDYKQFTPGEPIYPGTLLILEQIPGIIEVADMSVYLQENTYWASYNLPYFPYIFNISGARARYEKFGSWFSYEGAPRAQMFKRDHGKVVDMESMMRLMRYNDYQHDPLSRCNCTPPYSGENAISARSDLNPADGKYPFGALGHREEGGIDAKVTNSELIKELQCMAVSGPTHDQQPVFKWSTSGWKRPMGHPDAWDFEPVKVTWE
ncbi:putative phospholipase B-like 2 [Orbicella faveolata]|uniref:putative phospholipase B-like 2 n=1 Tax=Orbicella faveolata TaxID=48498 RepID=UPI0009E1A89F|nr:putative phospholipase B-like 2 [Orbicella faveolata]